MRLSIQHTTAYRFSSPVLRGLQRLRLKPKDTQGQIVREWHMELDGAKIEVEYDDHHHHHNATALVSLQPGASQVSVTCKGIVDTSDKAGVIGHHSGHMPLWTFLRPTALTRAGPKVRALVSSIGADRGRPLEVLHDLVRAVREVVAYKTGVTGVETTAEQALQAGQGVCQDQAHVFVSAGRLVGIPMRYVGGYLMINDWIDQEAGHGWAEAHIHDLGWVGFDVSNGISPDERYVRVTTGCDYRDAAPVTGLTAGAGTITLDVDVSVRQHKAESGWQEQQQQQGHFG